MKQPELLGFQQLDLFGSPACPARRGQSQVNSRASGTAEISEGSSCASSENADQKPSSASKSQPPSISDGWTRAPLRKCGKCSEEKTPLEFYKNSKGRYRKWCKNCSRHESRERKKEIPARVKSDSFKRYRKQKRGFILFNQARSRAKLGGKTFTLTEEDRDRIQAIIDAGYCQVTAMPFNLEGGKTWDSPSLDRIDNSRGYESDNIRVVLYCLNVMANVWGPNKVVEIGKAIMAQRRLASEVFQSKLTGALKRLIPEHQSPEFEMIWQEKATPSGLRYSLLRASARRTSDTGCSGSPALWATPRAIDATSNRETIEDRVAREGRATCSNLTTMAELAFWQTPSVSDGTGGHLTRGGDRSNEPLLPGQAKLACWPTPDAQDFGSGDSRWEQRREEIKAQGINGNGFGLTLGMAAQLAGWASPMCGDAKQARNETAGRQPDSRHHSGQTLSDQTRDLPQASPWATPAARDWKDGRASQETLDRNARPLNEQVVNYAPGTTPSPSPAATARRAVSRLNPAHSRWLMGFSATWDRSSPGWSDWDMTRRLLERYYAETQGTAPADSGATATP